MIHSQLVDNWTTCELYQECCHSKLSGLRIYMKNIFEVEGPIKAFVVFVCKVFHCSYCSIVD